MRYAKFIKFGDETEEDIAWLALALEGDVHETTIEVVREGQRRGEVFLFRLDLGIAVATITEYPAGKELFLAFLAGEGYLKNFNAFLAEMEDYARTLGCRWFAGMSARKGTRRVYEKVGKEAGTLFIREIANGRDS